MNNWLIQLHAELAQQDAIVLVSVLKAGGSVPRYPGSKMLVGADVQRGTIGGGNLEYSAIRIARERLTAQHKAPMSKVFQLGPSLGQCCGGRVELLFEYVHRSSLPQHLLSATSVKRAICNVDKTAFEVADMPFAARNRDNNILFIKDDAGVSYLTEPVARALPTVWVFGAGHVGQAVVQQLSLLPCTVKWLDEREEVFPQEIPANVDVCSAVSVVDEVVEAPDRTFFVVMTHSHSLDFELCLSILQRSFAYLGLIGSKTKRAGFEKRLLHRGLSADQLARLVCPIGIGGIRSGEPHAIAVGLAQQLLTYWQKNDGGRALDDKSRVVE